MDFVGFDKLSLLDYQDKIAVVLFSRSCPFACPFCHNGQTILKSDNYIPFSEILDYLDNRKGMIDAVVFSGGEPTTMPDLIDKIRIIKSKGFLVKLDTNGTHPEIIEKLLNEQLLDYIAMDIKNSEKQYAVTCGVKYVSLAAIKRSIKLIMNSGIDYEFRTTLVDEFFTIDSIEGMKDLIKGAKKVYLQKFVERDSCLKKGLHEVPLSRAKDFLQVLAPFVEDIELRGY